MWKVSIEFPALATCALESYPEQRMVQKSLRSLLMLSAVQLAALLLFCKGFFPYKTYLPGFATTAHAPPHLHNSDTTSSMEPEFDRLVFVLVDALRKYVLSANVGTLLLHILTFHLSDFVFENSSGFSFVKRWGTVLLFLERFLYETNNYERL